MVAEQISIEEQYEAEREVLALDQYIDSLHLLPAEERMRKELSLERRMERLERRIRGTKANNRLLYLLADWHVTHAVDDAMAYIEQLSTSPYAAHKGSLDIVRTRYFLKKGDTVKARELVDKLTERIPEFETLSDMVALYERRGADAPHVEGNNLSGGSSDPLKDAKEPFLLYCFVELTSDWHRLLIKEHLEELSREAYDKKIKLVCVSFDSKYISGLTHWNELAEDQDWELLWANPAPKGDAENWKKSWGVYSMPAMILIGADRKILDINPALSDLQTIAGVEQKESFDGHHHGRPRKGPRWR